MPKFEVLYKATVESLVVVDAPTAEKARELVARRGTDAGVVIGIDVDAVTVHPPEEELHEWWGKAFPPYEEED